MKQILKQAYFNILTINSILKKINLVLIAYFAISSTYANNHPIIIQQNSIALKDSSGIDSTKTRNVVLITDSSKLFTNLLSTSANKSPGFTINAEAKFFVDDYIKKHTAYFNNMKVWGKPYFNLYDRILASNGIPVQLKYLSVIESSLSSNAVSWAGAVGPWQIMADVAREQGLRTGYYTDDRADYIKSTNAACRILKDLYAKYEDWLLVIAAYNTGAGNVNKAIAKARSKNFWDIQYYLPLETRNHVKKFIATHYFFEGNGSIATATGNEIKNTFATTATTTIAKKDTYFELAAKCIPVNLYGKYNSVVIANNLMMDTTLFNQLNPDLDNVLSKGEIYPMRIPSDKVQLFQAKKMDILKQSVELLLNNTGSTTSK
jgi:membrane-bound lytic murein transglycosylase D